MSKHEKTNRKPKKRRKRAARSGASKAPTQKEVIAKRISTQKNHPSKKWAAGELIPSGSNYPLTKYHDIGSVPAGGRQIEYWEFADIVPLFPRFRKAKTKLPASFHFHDHAFLMDYFGLRGWEFGKWVTNEDRMNYVCATGIAYYDLRQVLGFPRKQMGLEGMVSMAIGARGKSRASAHFEPHTFAINLTRYKDNPGPSVLARYPFLSTYPKMERFLNFGGVGALAHEYGHALDYFFGGYVDQDKTDFALTGGRSVRTAPDMALLQRKGIRAQMEKILFEIIWEKEGHRSNYYRTLKSYLADEKIKSDYLIRRNELFARVFEQYIGYKLKQKGITNTLLHQRKYKNISYLPEAHLKKITPSIDRLISLMRAYLKTV